jgi:hypothetical protein
MDYVRSRQSTGRNSGDKCAHWYGWLHAVLLETGFCYQRYGVRLVLVLMVVVVMVVVMVVLRGGFEVRGWRLGSSVKCQSWCRA